MPFCGVQLRGQKPLPEAYPRELRTIGDHVRKRRLDLGLRQKDVARLLGANVNTVTNWEVGRSTPVLRYVPGIVRFLGYVPFPTDGLLPQRLRAYRQVFGLSQRALANRLGVDESTVWHWEQGTSRPNKERAERINALLAFRPCTNPTSLC